MNRVVHLRKDPFDVRIDRASPWGNPYRIGAPHPETGEPMTREDVLDLHEEFMLLGEGRRLLEHRLGELESLTPGCWCAPEGGLTVHAPFVCHGQVLARLLFRRRHRPATRRSAKPPRRFVFSGSRNWAHRGPIRRAIAGLPEVAVVVTGGARGADAIAELEAGRRGLEVEVHEADWDRHGRSAGPRRNEAMLALPGVERLFAFRSPGRSPGTDGAVALAKEAEIPGRLVREK